MKKARAVKREAIHQTTKILKEKGEGESQPGMVAFKIGRRGRI